MSESTEFRCPHCGQLYHLSAEQHAQYAGRTSTCRKCNQPFTFPDAPADDTAIRPPATVLHYQRPGGSGFNWKDFFDFRFLITIPVIKVLFWIGVVGVVLAGIIIMIGSVSAGGTMVIQGGRMVRTTGFSLPVFLVGLFWVLLGPVAVRLGCEFIIVIFRIHETLTEIRNDQKERRF